MSIKHLHNIDVIECSVNENFNPKGIYNHKEISFNIFHFVYLPPDGFNNQAKVVLMFEIVLTDSILKNELLKYVAEKHFVIKLDDNKDFKMLRNVVNRSYIILRSIFIIKLGVQLANEIFNKQPKDFDEISYRIIEEIDLNAIS